MLILITTLGNNKVECKLLDFSGVLCSQPCYTGIVFQGDMCSQPRANKPVKPVKLKSVKSLLFVHRKPSSCSPLSWPRRSLPISLQSWSLRVSPPAPSRSNWAGGDLATDRCQTSDAAEGKRGQLLSASYKHLLIRRWTCCLPTTSFGAARD